MCNRVGTWGGLTNGAAMGHAEHAEWLARQVTVRAPLRYLKLEGGKTLPQGWAAFVAPDETPIWLGQTASDPGIPMWRFTAALGAGLAGIVLLAQGAVGAWPFVLLTGLGYAAYATLRFKHALDDHRRAPCQTYLLTNRAVHAADRSDSVLTVTASLRLTPATQVDQRGRALHLVNPDQPDAPLILHSLAHPRAVCSMIQDIQKAQA